jgi:DNA-binding HxlR family transcriptional regulator
MLLARTQASRSPSPGGFRSGDRGRLRAVAVRMTMDRRRDAVAASADIIGAKWTALLIYDLAEGTCRFRELEQSCAGISSRTLAERLRALQRAGIVRRHSYPESPPRVEYELTDKGRDLIPILEAMTDFGRSWLVPADAVASAS